MSSKVYDAYMFHLKFRYLSIIGSILVLFFCYPTLFSQENLPVYLTDNQWQSPKDQKDWSNYLEIISEADKLIQKSNDIYLQAYAAAADTLESDKKKEAEFSKLESDAIKHYKNALLKFQEAYTGLYAVTINYIDDKLKAHPAYNDMVNYSSQASEQYILAHKGESDTDRENLSKANELQLLAIEMAVKVITTPAQTYVSETGTSPVTKNDEAYIEINDGLYNKYKDYTTNSEIPDPITAQQLMSLESEEKSFESFEQMWLNYMLQEEIKKQQDSLSTVTDTSITKEAAALAAQYSINNNTETESSAEKTLNTNKNTTTTSSNKTTTSSNKSSAAGYILSDRRTEGLNEFRVQIAANKTPLSYAQLKAIYTGYLSVIEIKEGNYFKYQIPGFLLYTEAQVVCDKSGVNNSYLCAYKNNQSIPLSLAVKETRALEQEVKTKGRDKVIVTIDFSVQVAASKSRISALNLNSIYSGPETLTLVFEEGWYKYQICTGGDLSKALQILDICGVKKAFLVAYSNGSKLKTSKAINEYKSQ